MTNPDLLLDPNEIGRDGLVETWISQGPRADDPTFDPKPGDLVRLIDVDAVEQQGRVTRRDGNRVWVAVTMTEPAPDTYVDLLSALHHEMALAELSQKDRLALVNRADELVLDLARDADDSYDKGWDDALASIAEQEPPPHQTAQNAVLALRIRELELNLRRWTARDVGEEHILPTNLGMVCTCGPDRLAAADAALDAVLAQLSAGSRHFHPHPVTSSTFLSEAILSLTSLGANVAGIHYDQWALLIVEGFDAANNEVQAVVQADRVEDALARAWSFVAGGGFRPVEP